MSFFETLFSILFPDHCVGCTARGHILCASCFKKIPPASAPRETFIISIFSYADFRVRRIVKLLKYKNTRHAARIFGSSLALALSEFLGEEHLFVSPRILLVPVPLSKARRKSRGYNQAELLAQALVSHFDTATFSLAIDTELLEKVRDTNPQAEIARRSDRLSNLDGSFQVRAGRVTEGHTIVLIDDVTTTGATLNTARKALLQAGFRQVYALTVAH
jgi:ComF family protein